MSEVGHNSGAASPAELAGDAIDAMLARLLDRRDVLIAGEMRAKVEDDDTVGRGGDLIGQMRTLTERAEMAEKEVREPYDQACRTASARVDKFLDPLRAAETSIKAKIKAFRDAERTRAQEQQDEQRQLETAAIAAKAPTRSRRPTTLAPPEAEPVSLPGVRGDFGTTTSDRRVKVYEITDVHALPDIVLNHDKVIEALKSACRDANKLMKTIPGCKISTVVDNTTRR